MTLSILPLSFSFPSVPPTTRIRHADKTYSSVVRNILCNGYRIGIIWCQKIPGSRDVKFHAWWLVAPRDVPVRDMQAGSLDHYSLLAAMYSSSRRISHQVRSAISLSSSIKPCPQPSPSPSSSLS